MAPFFTDKEHQPVLNKTRIRETLIGSVIVALVTGSFVFFTMSKETDAIVSTKLEIIVKTLDDMNENLDNHYREDMEYRLTTESRLSRHAAILEGK